MEDWELQALGLLIREESTRMRKRVRETFSITELARMHRDERLEKFGTDVCLQNFRQLIKKGGADY